ncbi:MAG TPA: nitronate monooxygenase [Iamia sp.]
MLLDRLAVPVVLAPMAGGPSTPELATAVTEAGGLGFLAAGYLGPDRVAAEVAEVRRRTDGPLGVNLFSPPAPLGPGAAEAVAAYADRLAPRAARHGVTLGPPRHDDDGFAAKVALLRQAPVDVVSFTFGPPPAEVVDDLHAAGIEVWSTVTDRAEAAEVIVRGVDVLVAQGAEAGGHQGSTLDDDRPPHPVLDLVAAVAGLGRPVVAAGGIVDGADLAAALAAGAGAGQVGTAFLLCPEAGTSPVHRAAVARGGPTVLTRAFTGRRARGLANGWTREVVDAPVAYPDVHHLTAPLRAHGRAVGDPDLVNLWAGTGVDRVVAAPAASVVAALTP